MGDGKAAGGKRAIGIRDRIISYLQMTGDIADANGMASAVLAEAVGYPGSSAAFAQLLSGMERADLIQRQIRGKRTYQISLGGAARAVRTASRALEPGSLRWPGPRSSAAMPAPAMPAPAMPARAMSARRGGGTAGGPAGGPAGLGDERGRDLAADHGGDADFDYDELARRLLVQVVRRLAAGPAEWPPPSAGEFAVPPDYPGPGPETDLAAAVASLEQTLASAQSRQRKLTAENAKLREQLRAAQQGLMAAQERAERPARQLDTAEMQLLDRLLFALRGQSGQRGEAGAS